MARTINASSIFSRPRYYPRTIRSGDAHHAPAHMKLQLKSDIIEIPTLFLYRLKDNIINNNSFYENFDQVVFTLKDDGLKTMYKSLDAAMKDILTTNECDYLIGVDTNGVKYYCNCGSIFDNEFKPLMICSWKYEVSKRDDKWFFHGIEPIIRIEPKCFVYKATSVERYIIGKFLTNMLIINPFNATYYPDRSYISYEPAQRPKVLIEEIPFKITFVDKPTISTTNEMLCNIAKTHISEMF